MTEVAGQREEAEREAAGGHGCHHRERTSCGSTELSLDGAGVFMRDRGVQGESLQQGEEREEKWGEGRRR
eukprot:767506-Hanusia_phi.AAC.5